MCAAYSATNNDTDDKDDGDDDRYNPPSRAIPRHFRDGGLGGFLQLPSFGSESHGARATVICKWSLDGRYGPGVWKGGRTAIAAIVQ